jgi:hypothetical protein
LDVGDDRQMMADEARLSADPGRPHRERQIGPDGRLARNRRPQPAKSHCEKSQTSSGSVLVDLASSHIYCEQNIAADRFVAVIPILGGTHGRLSADLAGSGLATPWAIMCAPRDPIALPYRRRVRSRPFPSEPPAWLATKST